MKKVLPLLLLLFLLIILCVYTKIDSIKVNGGKLATMATATSNNTDQRYIDYTISQIGEGYVLKGNFNNTDQQTLFVKTIKATNHSLKVEGTTTNQTLLGDPAIALTNKILPHFVANYDKGKIVYSEQKLKIYGSVKSYEAQHEMQRLLNSSKHPSQDNSSVIVQRPITFSITKKSEKMHLTGVFENDAQIMALKSKLPQNIQGTTSIEAHRVDKGIIAYTQAILPAFTSKYTSGKINYTKENLTITGMVQTESDLIHMRQLIAQTNADIINHTSVDPEALKRATLAAAKAEADLKRAADKAKVTADLKLAADKAKVTADLKLATDNVTVSKNIDTKVVVKKAKANINHLLQLENIEFEVAKGSLTAKGKATVNKLGKILQQYASIHIEIAGHTDSDGSSGFNQRLSQSRVDTVKSRLTAQGIKANRLTAKGYGESKPLVPNTNDRNKQKNRRVEINIQGE